MRARGECHAPATEEPQSQSLLGRAIRHHHSIVIHNRSPLVSHGWRARWLKVLNGLVKKVVAGFTAEGGRQRTARSASPCMRPIRVLHTEPYGSV